MRSLTAVGQLSSARATPFPVGVARAGVGVAALIQAFEVLPQLKRLSDLRLLRLPRIEALPVVAASGASVFLVVWVLAGLAFTLGWHTRVAGALTVSILGYVLAVDHQMYSNHLYLLLLLTFLLTLADSGAAFSLDSRRREPTETIPAWPVLLIRLQVSIVYGFAALAKLNLVFASGVVLRTHLQLPGLGSLPAPLFAAASMLAIAVEALLAVAFWKPGLRRPAVVTGIGFHLTILATMRVVPDLITFTVLMGSAYLAFFSTLSREQTAAGAPGVQLAGRPEVTAATSI